MNEQEIESRIKQLEDLTFRSFDPQVVMEMLIPDDERTKDYIDWNVEQDIAFIPDENGGVCGMMLKLNHRNYTDCILITMSFFDFFNVHFVSKQLKVLHSIENIEFDCLFDTINEQLENVTKIPIRYSLN